MAWGSFVLFVSGLSGAAIVTSPDGVGHRVQIYRLKTGNNGWSLEVVDHENASTVWDDLFATDHEAFAKFSRTLEDEGIQSFRARLN
jgi:hypothetical protein